MISKLSPKISPYKHWEYLNLATRDCLRIVPERGGVITSWICQGREMLYFDQARFENTSKSIRGGIPILFPICGDLQENKFNLNNKEYSMNQHGFARNSAWKLNSLDDNYGLTLELNEDPLSLCSYPFEFRIEIDIRLNINSLELISRITNKSDKIMPFSFGFHPYFLVNDLEQIRIDGLPDRCFDHLAMNTDATQSQLKNLSKGVDFLAKTNHLLTLYDQVDNIILELSTNEPFDFNVIWTDPPRKMVCLEPWTSPRNSMISRENLILLPQKEQQELKCKFSLYRSS